jgi:16S rRNA (guanine527-N7)-methyltransferase
VPLSPVERLVSDGAALGVSLTEADAAALLRLTQELARWNERFNLTAIRSPEAMLTHHLLDSLSVSSGLAGTRIADAGTGAGFPGLPLAFVNKERQFTLIDSTAKKIRFVEHAVQLLKLTNVTVVQARVEKFRGAPFDTVVARAFGPLPRLVRQVAPLCGEETRVLAMKGRWPQAEIDALPASWRVAESRVITIPGLEAARCVISLVRA